MAVKCVTFYTHGGMWEQTSTGEWINLNRDINLNWLDLNWLVVEEVFRLWV